MTEYAMTVFVICIFTGALGLIAHGALRDAERLALGIITLYVIIAPITDAVKDFDADAFFDSISGGAADIESGYAETAEEALAEGIALAVAKEFSISRDNIRVRLRGFDFETMACEEIGIILSGSAALSDYKAVERYINKMEIGVCKVEIEIG
nr:hypothetical protein [Oscillospiraceae bacterium]